MPTRQGRRFTINQTETTMEHPIDLTTILQAEASEAATLLSSYVRQCVRSKILTMMQEEVGSCQGSCPRGSC